MTNLALASASALGAEGKASATATSSGGAIASLVTSADADAGKGQFRSYTVASTIVSGDDPGFPGWPYLQYRQAASTAVGLPGAEPVAVALDGNSAVAEAFASLTAGEALLLGLLGGSHTSGTGDALGTSYIDLTLNAGLLDGQDLFVGFLDPVVRGKGFDELRFSIVGGDSVLADELFLDAASALAYFDDRFIRLGDVPLTDVDKMNLRLSLQMRTSGPDDGFFVDFIGAGAAPVPLPPTLALLLTALAAGGLRMPRHRRPLVDEERS